MGKATPLMSEIVKRKIDGGSVPSIPRVGIDVGRPMPGSRYFRDTPSGIFNGHPVTLRPEREDIRSAWPRSAALATNLIQNSGSLRGVADQIITDTVGGGLQLNYKPNFSGTQMSDVEQKQYITDVKNWWRRWANNAKECDQRGKFTVDQQIDIALRWNMAFGEVTGMIEYMPRIEQRRHNIETGTKLLLVPPTQLVQETNGHNGLFQGVWHDGNGRPFAYRFRDNTPGYKTVKDYPAHTRSGMPYVLHHFDPMDADAVRGISAMAAGFRTHLQRNTLKDATLQTAVLQNVFAATLTSEQPTEDALAGIEALKEFGEGKAGEGLQNEFIDYMSASLDASARNSVKFGSDPQINHLAPGEKLEIHSTQTPGSQYLPFDLNLARDMARALGVTLGSFTMNHENATYSSVRMESAIVSPLAGRKLKRIAAPICQAVFEAGLDEQIRLGRITFKPGYRFFAAHRRALCNAKWQGPAKPSADDYKSARASSERLENGTSSLEIECAELGHDPEQVRAERLADHEWHIEHDMRSPYDRDTSDRPELKDDESKPGAQSQ